MLNLEFIQTSFSFLQNDLNAFQKNTHAAAVKLFPDQITDGYIKSSTGFIHAHDITLVLAQAWRQSQKDGAFDKQTLKSALENINTPVQGLIKKIHKTFWRVQ